MKRSSYDQRFLRYRNGVFLAFLASLGKRPLPSLITRQIRDQDHKIDQKKSDPLNPSKVDTSLTLPLVYVMFLRFTTVALDVS